MCAHACRSQGSICVTSFVLHFTFEAEPLIGPGKTKKAVSSCLHLPSSNMLPQFFRFAKQALYQLSQLPQSLELLLTMQYIVCIHHFPKDWIFVLSGLIHRVSYWCLQMLLPCLYDWVMEHSNDFLLTYMYCFTILILQTSPHPYLKILCAVWHISQITITNQVACVF